MFLTSDAMQRLLHLDTSLCILCNRIHQRRFLTAVLRACSRLGDGIFWYGLMLTLPLFAGWGGLRASVHLNLTGILCVLLYKYLKGRTVRPRPYVNNPDIKRVMAPLDQYSFPSGHTLHAVAFTLIALAHFPALWPLLVPFTLLVALSRPALGLHYPSDVLAGAAIGATIAGLNLVLWNYM
ncbi:MAG: phosphatase PAP2 family protein [Gammaproteobacteria bacterium]|nr:phosphatase PAP2 family protein [Gammaproteobacteria bacterium]